tara:strand:+ start:604 stop:1125 length:522 start_codon:yes stop_codon:yes gene_type:complete
MKITEVIIAPKEPKDTISSGTISSAIKGDQTQDIVPQNIVPENDLALEVDSIETHPDHSAIAEGVSQILRRTKGKAPKQGFRCSSGPRKGRIVAKPSTCFQKTDPVKSAKIRKKRSIKATQAGKKLAQTKRSGAGSLRLKGAQIKKAKNKGRSVAKKIGGRGPVRSKIVRAKK